MAILRDVAERAGIAERAVHMIVADLEAGGGLVRHKAGRRNHYEIQPDTPLRHPVEWHKNVRDLLAVFGLA